MLIIMEKITYHKKVFFLLYHHRIDDDAYFDEKKPNMYIFVTINVNCTPTPKNYPKIVLIDGYHPRSASNIDITNKEPSS